MPTYKTTRRTVRVADIIFDMYANRDPNVFEMKKLWDANTEATVEIIEQVEVKPAPAKARNPQTGVVKRAK